MLDVTSDARPLPGDVVIAGGGDEVFAIGIAVTLYSTLVNIKAGRVFFYVLDGGISEATKQRFQAMLKPLPVDLHLRYLNVDTSRYTRLKTPQHLTPMTYLRLALPEMLPDVERILYLDTDLVIHRDVTELFSQDFAGNYAIAVRELGYGDVRFGLPATYETLGLMPDAPYCNAGVMVLNLEAWRRENIAQRILDYTVRYADTNLCGDQDGVNAVLAGHWKAADPRWNVQVGSMLNLKHLADTEYRREIIPKSRELLQHPYILHFIGRKPWQAGLFNPARPLFVKYLARSGWFAPPELAAWKRDWLLQCARDLPKGFTGKISRRFA